jgi:sugar phosphate isomerase/epimerase
VGIRIGNAASPRWYDLSDTRLEEYIDRLVEWGATSAELVLHRGEADEQTARVHVLEEDWFRVFERYRAHGIVCHAHAPLHPRFKLDREQTDPDGLRADLLPVIEAVAEFSRRQGETCVLVLHGASGEPSIARESTKSFLTWCAEVFERTSAGGRLAIELRRPRTLDDQGFDRSRTALASFVHELGIGRVGICWDLGHDWEGRMFNPAWTPRPDDVFLDHVSHIHLHDAGGVDDAVHFPLQSGRIPWKEQLDPILDRGYQGAITLEVRYRFARSMGEPWNVLGGSYALLRSYLETRKFGQPGENEMATA